MDVLSKRGQEFTRIQREVVKEYQVHNPYAVMIQTPNNQPAKVDYLICDTDRDLWATMEFKVRKSGITTKEFESGKYAIFNQDKFLDGAQLADLLRVPFYMWMYMIDSGNLYSWKVTDNEGNITVPYDAFEMKAQRNINDKRKRNLPRVALGRSTCKRILEGFKVD